MMLKKARRGLLKTCMELAVCGCVGRAATVKIIISNIMLNGMETVDEPQI